MKLKSKLLGLAGLGAAVFGLYKLGEKKIQKENADLELDAVDIDELSNDDLEKIFEDDDVEIFDDEETTAETVSRVANVVKVGAIEAANIAKEKINDYKDDFFNKE